MPNTLNRLAVVGAFAALALTGCSATSSTGAANAPASSTPAPATSTPAPAGRSVTYDVTGDGGAASNVSYSTFSGGGGGTESAANAVLPFQKVVPISDANLLSTSVFSLVGQAGPSGTTISCKITVDGKVIAQQTSTGAYAVVTCSGTAG